VSVPGESDSETCVQHAAAAHGHAAAAHGHAAAAHGHANDGRHARATAHATHDISPDAYRVSFKR